MICDSNREAQRIHRLPHALPYPPATLWPSLVPILSYPSRANIETIRPKRAGGAAHTEPLGAAGLAPDMSTSTQQLEDIQEVGMLQWSAACTTAAERADGLTGSMPSLTLLP